MKKLPVLIALAFIVALTTTIATFAFAQDPTIPNIHGVWLVRGSEDNMGWDATRDTELLNVTVDICYCDGTYADDVPNFILVPHDDPSDFFLGFVRDRGFAFYKNDSEPGNVGLEMLIGRVGVNEKRLGGKALGFDSNYAWGSIWSISFGARKISDATSYCSFCP